MATYYVRPAADGGSDSNNGTSAATAWATVSKALNSGGIADTTVANTIYVAPGVYRQVHAPTLTTPTAEQSFIADVDAAHFPGATGGRVQLTAYLTDDATAPSGSALLALGTKSFLTFEGFQLVGANLSTCCVSTTAGITNVTFRRCSFVGGRNGTLVTLNLKVSATSDWLFDQCIFEGNANANSIAISGATQTTGADWDAGVVIRNCLFLGGNSVAVSVTGSGANSFKPGGVDLINCTVYGAFTTTGTSTSVPCTVTNCVFRCHQVPLNAATSGQITEDYNVLFGGSAPRTNVTTGSNSTPTPSAQEWVIAPLFENGFGPMIGLAPRAYSTPEPGCGVLGFGTASGTPAVDLLNRPRPAGGNTADPAAGAYERHDTMTRDSTVSRTSGNAGKFVGPGDHEFKVPVDNISTTFTAWVRYASANYGAGTKPQMVLVADGEIGVSAATDTATASAADAWEELSLTFTPTNPGIATVRFVSSAAANGECWVDDFSAT